MIDLKAFRLEENISQSELCAVLGIAQPYLSAIENRKRPLNEKKFTLLYKQYGDIILKYKLSEKPALLIEEVEASLHPNILKYLGERISKEEKIPTSVPYEFVQAMIDERKRHDEMNAELIRQNGILIDRIKEEKKGAVQEDVSCATAESSGLVG